MKRDEDACAETPPLRPDSLVLLILLPVIALAIPLVQGLSSSDALAEELDRVRSTWFRGVVLGEPHSPTESQTATFPVRALLEESRIFSAARFSPELKNELEELIILAESPPTDEVLRRTEEQFTTVRTLASYLEAQSDYTYQSLLILMVSLLIGFAVLYRFQAVRLKAITIERDATDRMRLLALAVQEKERHRLARELHDETAQSLALARMLADKLEKCDEAQRLQQILSGALRDIRAVCEQMKPPTTWAEQPGELLRTLASSIEERYPIKVRLLFREFSKVDWDEEVYLHLYRIAQEGLVNIIRHAQVDEAFIRVEETDGRICITITDHGLGLNNMEPGMGRRGMLERAELIGGELTWSAPPGGGTAIRLLLEKRIHLGS